MVIFTLQHRLSVSIFIAAAKKGSENSLIIWSTNWSVRTQNNAGGKCIIHGGARNSTSLCLTQDNPPPSYPGRAIFSLISLKSSINRLHLVGETTRVGETRLGR